MLFRSLGSLKSPLRGGLMALRSLGCRVTSVHPMFGPDTELLSGRHVVFVDLGDAGALQAARDRALVTRLRAGGDVTTAMADRLRAFMSTYRPAPRPKRRRSCARPAA